MMSALDRRRFGSFGGGDELTGTDKPLTKTEAAAAE
jgi:hypothetical protein